MIDVMDHSLSAVGIGFGPGFEQKGKKLQRPTVPLVNGNLLQLTIISISIYGFKLHERVASKQAAGIIVDKEIRRS